MIEYFEGVVVLRVGLRVFVRYSFQWPHYNVEAHMKEQFDEICHIRCSNEFSSIRQWTLLPIWPTQLKTKNSINILHGVDLSSLRSECIPFDAMFRGD